ncbi:SRPBCC family protein [Candidatus Micrarchaeota archaeon]|nr:SRPBCC family protein [Candidatus Micrarchaeota archaeon]
MTKVEREIVINAPTKKVWAFVSDADNLLDLVPGPLKPAIRMVKHFTTPKQRARFTWGINFQGFEFNIDGEIAAWQPEKGVTYRSVTEPRVQVSFVLAPSKGGTRLYGMADYDLPFELIGGMLGIPNLEQEAEKSIYAGFDTIRAKLEVPAS